MFRSIATETLLGIKAIPIQIEVDISSGLPGMTMVGLLSNEARESKDRVIAAMKNIGIAPPLAKITVNFSPADVHKQGTAFDVPLALGILSAMELMDEASTNNKMFFGELGLNGEIRAVPGILPMVQEARLQGITECIVPYDNIAEGNLVPGIKVLGAKNLVEVMSYLRENDATALHTIEADTAKTSTEASAACPDFSDVKGQLLAKRAAIISAAGFHSLLMTGPPGSGKSMIAKRIPGILPPLSTEESLELTTIHSIAGKLSPQKPYLQDRSFEAPHHSATPVSILGGGVPPRPGSISLAHKSVLFLDELTEFDRHTLDMLRQPLEDHEIHLSRSKYSIVFPSDFLLVAAMNPCPCGFYPDRNRCRCTQPQIHRYMSKISGPILDRIDLCVELQATSIDDLQAQPKAKETSISMRAQVDIARSIQVARYKGTHIRYNSQLTSADLESFCPLGKKEATFMADVYQKLQLSARSYHRIIKVARTIADLAESEQIKQEHLMEAITYRPINDYWR